MHFRLKGSGGQLNWAFHLGREQSTKSIIKLNGDNYYDFQHSKRYFDDFKESTILRILDGQIEIIHDQDGRKYFAPKYVQDNRIIKNNFRILEISGDILARKWTIQPIEIVSG